MSRLTNRWRWSEIRAVVLRRDRYSSSPVAHFANCDEAASELRKLGHVVRRGGGGGVDDSSFAGLTRRELEVIEFVATGKTNREIANELFLSARTVDRHVSRIFEKLGVNSRAAAASQFERARAGGGT
jgi:DNA-binding NarL/FixJ family response regulator